MKTLSVFLFCLITTQAARTWRNMKGHRYSVRETGDTGYNYQAPSQSGGGSFIQQQAHTSGPSGGSGGGGDNGYQYQTQEVGNGVDMMAHHDMMASIVESTGGAVSQDISSGIGGSAAGSAGGNAGYHYEAPAAQTNGDTGGGNGGAAPVGFEDIQNFATGATAALQGHTGSSGNSFGSSGGLSLGGSNGGTGGFDFNSVLNAGGGSGSSDQFTGVQGEVIDENPPSIFKYKPMFGGKDINNLPHILPPGGKSIQELQDEADAKLRSIVAKAKMNQMDVVDRIAKLRTNYGFGTLGYEGFKDTRFKKMGEIDLGTHKGIDLGTSIDYNALKGSDGKLKLPVQNVYHTKTLGIHIPEPYPVKHEVAVPAPFPVPHPIPVPQHKPTQYSPLSHEDIAHLSADDGRSSFFGSFGSYGGGGGGSEGAHFGGQSFGSGFGFDEKGPTNTFKGVSTGTFSIQPSQSISESSTIGGLPYGAGTPNAADSSGEGGDTGTGHVEYTMDDHSQGQVSPAAMYGLPAGSLSGALTSYEGPAQGSAHSSSQGQAISSEAGMVHIPAMNFGSNQETRQEGGGRPHVEYGPPR